MKIAICDICVADGKLKLAKRSMRDRRLGLTIMFCTEHKAEMEKAKTGNEFAHILINADNGYNTILEKA